MFEDNIAGYGIKIAPETEEELAAIGYFSMHTETSDIAEIYKLPETEEDYYIIDELGDPVATVECDAITGGYHTFALKQSIDISPGEEYLVLIKPGQRAKLVYEKAMNSTSEEYTDDWQHNLGAIHTVNSASGNSYLYSADGEALIRQDDKDFFVKVYTNNREE